jgi:hypothetical protein
MSGQGDVCYDADPENEEKSKVILPVVRFSCVIAVVTFKEAVKSVTVPKSFTKLVSKDMYEVTLIEPKTERDCFPVNIL